MYAVEFEAPINNGIVHIPKEYEDLQENNSVRFVAIYEKVENDKKDEKIKKRLEEFHKLIEKVDNKVMLTHDLAIDTDEMVEDGLL